MPTKKKRDTVGWNHWPSFAYRSIGFVVCLGFHWCDVGNHGDQAGINTINDPRSGKNGEGARRSCLGARGAFGQSGNFRLLYKLGNFAYRIGGREMTEGFEVDRGAEGRIKINVISVANLIALIALLGTAIATWNGLTSKVDILNIRVDTAGQSITQIKNDLNTSLLSRDASARDLNNKVEVLGNRLTAVEVVLQRVERKLDTK